MIAVAAPSWSRPKWTGWSCCSGVPCGAGGRPGPDTDDHRAEHRRQLPPRSRLRGSPHRAARKGRGRGGSAAHLAGRARGGGRAAARWCGWWIRCSSTPSNGGPPTSTSRPRRARSCSSTGWTGCSTRRWIRWTPAHHQTIAARLKVMAELDVGGAPGAPGRPVPRRASGWSGGRPPHRGLQGLGDAEHPRRRCGDPGARQGEPRKPASRRSRCRRSGSRAANST